MVSFWGEAIMRQLRLAAVLALMVLLNAGDVLAQAPSCSAAAFEKDAATAYAACSALLEADLATSAKAEALKIRARTLHRLGRLDAAISDYETALALAPDDPELHLRRGWTHYDKQENEAALGRAGRALALDPKSAEAYDLAGAVMARLYDFGRAKAAYDDALRLDPHNLLVRLHRFQLFDFVGRLPQALAELDGILALPEAETRAATFEFHGRRVTYRTGAELHRAITLKAMGRAMEAGDIYDRLVVEDPSAVTYASRAVYRRNAETAPDSAVVADAEKAIALDPDYWIPRDVLARTHFYAKRYEAAAEEFARAIKLAPKAGNLRWWRSMTLRKLDRIDEATEDALSVLDVDPKFILDKKLAVLRERGYFVTPVGGADPVPALRDAVRACMLDERCW
jgi:tetratricopeptide (TPR) repeat protein